MATRFRSSLVRASLVCSVALLGALVLTAPVAAAGHHRVYVSPSGSTDNSGTSCQHAKYSSINDGIAAAPNHGVVIVCRGVYTEMVVVDKSVTVEGHHAVIDATGLDNGVLITHSWVTVERLTVHGATGEGILAMGDPGTGTPIDHVTIKYNVVRNNDQGGGPTPAAYPECQPQGQIPGDCGEGIHLMSVSDSLVRQNVIEGNSGGILLSDEFGPTHGNRIVLNLVQDNPYDCGITLAGHGFGWTGTDTSPATGGVYDNFDSPQRCAAQRFARRGRRCPDGSRLGGCRGHTTTTVDNNLIVGNNLAGRDHPLAPGAAASRQRQHRAHNVIGHNNVGSTDVRR